MPWFAWSSFQVATDFRISTSTSHPSTLAKKRKRWNLFVSHYVEHSKRTADAGNPGIATFYCRLARLLLDRAPRDSISVTAVSYAGFVSRPPRTNFLSWTGASRSESRPVFEGGSTLRTIEEEADHLIAFLDELHRARPAGPQPRREVRQACGGQGERDSHPFFLLEF